MKKLLFAISTLASLAHTCGWSGSPRTIVGNGDIDSGFVAEPDSYREAAIGEQLLFRWTNLDESAHIPLFVEIADMDHELPLGADREQAKILVARALEAWMSELDHEFDLTIRSHSEGERFTRHESIILVRFINDPFNEGHAVTRMYLDSGKAFSELVIDFPVPPSGFPSYSQSLMTHEFGHALGCLSDDGEHIGHSPKRGDVMYPSVSVQGLSHRDGATMREIYTATPLYVRADQDSLNAPAGDGQGKQNLERRAASSRTRATPWFGWMRRPTPKPAFAARCHASCAID